MITNPEGDVLKSTETLERQRPRLLFHVSGLGPDAVEPMNKFGLLAKSPTLTPRLDIGHYYSGGDLLTFWYPYKREINRGLSASTQTPTQAITKEMRSSMLEGVAKLDTEKWLKDAYKKIIDGAETFLPGERLRAAAKVRWPHELTHILPEDHFDFVSLYGEGKDNVILEVREALDHMKIDFLDPSLTKDILAQDIVRTYIEHSLLAIGSYPGTHRVELERNLSALEVGRFDDPVYERYRTMLIARIQKKLEEIQDTSNNV